MRDFDWDQVRRDYQASGSQKQTAAAHDISVNTLKARIRRDGWVAPPKRPAAPRAENAIRGKNREAILAAGQNGAPFTRRDVSMEIDAHTLRCTLAHLRRIGVLEVVRPAIWGRYGTPTVYRVRNAQPCDAKGAA